MAPALVPRCLQHVRLQYETEQVEDEIMEEYPRSMRHKVSRALYKRCVEDCYLFANCSGEFVNQIVRTAFAAIACSPCGSSQQSRAQGNHRHQATPLFVLAQ